MVYKVKFNQEIFNILLNETPSIFDVIKCEKGEFMIMEIEENEDMTDTLVVVEHETIQF